MADVCIPVTEDYIPITGNPFLSGFIPVPISGVSCNTGISIALVTKIHHGHISSFSLGLSTNNFPFGHLPHPLDSVTLNCQVTKTVMNSGSQLSEL